MVKPPILRVGVESHLSCVNCLFSIAEVRQSVSQLAISERVGCFKADCFVFEKSRIAESQKCQCSAPVYRIQRNRALKIDAGSCAGSGPSTKGSRRCA